MIVRPVPLAGLVAGALACGGNDVTRPLVGDVILEPAHVIVGVGARVTYTITVTDENGDSLPVDGIVTWRTTDGSIATVSNQGVGTATGLGDAWIFATAQGARDSSRFTVKVCPLVFKADEPFGPREPLPSSAEQDTMPADTLMSLIRRNNGHVIIGVKEIGSTLPPDSAYLEVTDRTYHQTRDQLRSLGLNICIDLRPLAAIGAEIPPVILSEALIEAIRDIPTVLYFHMDPPVFPF